MPIQAIAAIIDKIAVAMQQKVWAGCLQRKMKSVNAFILHPRKESRAILTCADGQKKALLLGTAGAGRSDTFAATGFLGKQSADVARNRPARDPRCVIRRGFEHLNFVRRIFGCNDFDPFEKRV
jgi:hypothetical protein